MTTFFMIEESVTPQGHYITLPEIYSTFIAADVAMMRLPSPEYMRVRMYQTGRNNGPERSPTNDYAPGN